MRVWLVFPLLLAACQGETVESAPADVGAETTSVADTAVDGAPVDGGAPVDSAPVDGAPVDSAVSDTSTPDGGASGELLSSNPGFEGCTGWSTTDASASESTLGRTGHSCRVCGNMGVYEYGLRQTIFMKAAPGTKLLAEAWIRADGGDGGVAPDPKGTVTLFDVGGTSVQGVDGSPISPDSTWRKVSVPVTVTPSTVAQIDVIFGSHQGGTCFLVDDASLRVVP